MSKASEGPEIEYDCTGWTIQQKQDLNLRLQACGVQVGDGTEPAKLLGDKMFNARWENDTLIAEEVSEATVDHVFWTMERYPQSCELLDADVYLGPLSEDDRPLTVSFVRTARRCVRKTFKARGRASRSEYWNFVLLWSLCAIIFGVALQPAVSNVLSDNSLPKEFLLVLLGPQMVLTPALVTATVRRFHDVGFSGFWWFLPIGNWIILALPSEKHANKFGPPPKESTQDFKS